MSFEQSELVIHFAVFFTCSTSHFTLSRVVFSCVRAPHTEHCVCLKELAMLSVLKNNPHTISDLSRGDPGLLPPTLERSSLVSYTVPLSITRHSPFFCRCLFLGSFPPEARANKTFYSIFETYL